MREAGAPTLKGFEKCNMLVVKKDKFSYFVFFLFIQQQQLVCSNSSGYSWQRIMWEVVEEKSGSGTIWTRKANSSSGEGGRCIPDICHFFYTGFPNPKFYTQKNTKNTPKHAKKSLKVLNICSFCVQSGKFYTWQNILTRAPPVVPVTNIRYV